MTPVQVTLAGTLGSGSWGTVYKGAWRGLPVAVKTMLFTDGPAGTPGVLPMERAVTEAAVCVSPFFGVVGWWGLKLRGRTAWLRDAA